MTISVLVAIVIATIACDSAGQSAAVVLGPNLLELPRPACIETMQ